MATGTTKRSAAARTGTTRKAPAKTAVKNAASKTTAGNPSAAKAPVMPPAKPPVKPPVKQRPRNTAAVQAAAPAPAAETVTVNPASSATAKTDLRKKELIEQVVAQSGVKKKDAKPVVEAMLSILGDTLAEGRELNLQPFGKLRINRSEERSNGRIIVCKLRQANPGGEKSQDGENSSAAPLADTEG